MVGYCVLGEQLFWVLRAEIGDARRWRGASALLLGSVMAGCSVSPPPGSFDVQGGALSVDASTPPTSSSGSGGTGGGSDSALIDAGPITPAADADVLPTPPPGCTEGATRPCGPATVKG